MVFNREKLEDIIGRIISDLPYFGDYKEYRDFAFNYIMYLLTRDPFYYDHAYKSYNKMLEYYNSIPSYTELDILHKDFVQGIVNTMREYLEALQEL